MALVDPRLLPLLACPACKSPIEVREADRLLVCKPCRKGYPVEDSIPIMLVEQARPLA